MIACRRETGVRAGICLRAGLAWLIALALPIANGPAHAADPQPYTITWKSTGIESLDATLESASQLATLQDKASVGPFALVTRARADVDRLVTVLHSFGYYQGEAGVTILDRPIDDPGLADAIEAIPEGSPIEVHIEPKLNPLYHLHHIAIDGEVPPDAAAQLKLSSGQPAVASDVLAAGVRLLTALQEDGFALAKVDMPVAIEDPDADVLDVTFKADTGAHAAIGPIVFQGLSAVNEDFVRRHLELAEGDLYQPSKIEEARQDLASLGVFSGVSVHAGDKIGADGRIPLTFDAQERPGHAVGITGAYSTDLGASVSTTWSDRNLFGNAEQLNLSAAGTSLGGTATRDLGYNITAQLIKPDFGRRDQALEFDAGGLKQSLEAYDQQALTIGSALRRKFSPLWTGSVGLTGTQENIRQENVARDYTLVGLPLTAKYDSTALSDPLQDPTHGLRAAFTATPTQSFGRLTSTFFILQVSGSTYFDLAALGITAPGRSVIALRGLIGSIQGAAQFDLPPDQRFYGGGSATVRGYKYQSIGPRFSDATPTGGTAIDAATVEFRQRLFGDFGIAAFADAGQVSAGNLPFSGTVRVGAGIGLRYYTPIGPVRLDAAVPLSKAGGDSFEVYIGLGQAF
jgi:translocation and assembly module TamA